jgi:hypothetical protein
MAEERGRPARPGSTGKHGGLVVQLTPSAFQYPPNRCTCWPRKKAKAPTVRNVPLAATSFAELLYRAITEG